MKDQLGRLEEYHPSGYKNHCRQIKISMGGNEAKSSQRNLTDEVVAVSKNSVSEVSPCDLTDPV